MAKNATDITIKTDNIYCPHCGAIQKKGENFCSSCGGDLSKKDEKKLGDSDILKKDEKKSPPAGRAGKPFYKKKVFIFFSALFLVAASTLAAVFYLSSTEGNQFKSKVKGVWQDVQKESEALNKEVQAMSKMDDFKKIAIKIKTLESVLEDEQGELDKLRTPDNFREGKEALLLGFTDFKSYLQVLRAAADNPSKMTDKDVEEIEGTADTAKTSFSKAYSKFDVIDKKLPDETFTIVSKFQDVRKGHEEKLATEEQEKVEKERQAQQESENKAKVESIVTSFMNAYIAGNEGELKKYMTSAFQKEFNYADLSSDARMYSYPESFRITSTKKTSDTQYDVYGRELQVNRESGSKWTINRHFAVIWITSDNKWLIDRWDISSE